MTLATLTSKGQVTIPKAVRESLQLHAGDKVEFVITEKREALLRPITRKVDEVFGQTSQNRKKAGFCGKNGKWHKTEDERTLQMKAVDTNVLIRFLVRDDIQQAENVYRLFKEAEASKQSLFVPITVTLETIRVLEWVYNVPRMEILDSINEMLLMPILKFEAQPAIMRFVSSARETDLDLSNILIAHSAFFSGCESMLTFDKCASSFGLFELLK